MSYFTGTLKCVRCGHELAPGESPYDGCSACKAEGISSNYTTVYDFSGSSKEEIAQKYREGQAKKGFWKHREFLPVDESVPGVDIGQGCTPLLHCKKLGEKFGLKNLYIKNETLNPTWSYKDRLCAVGVTRAVQEGAPAITVSSTGNHGAAAAACSAAAGLPCVVFTVPQVPQTMKTLMQAYGACVMVTPTSLDRWVIMRQCVEKKGWYPLSGYVAPPIGSNPYGVDGYKTIAFELFDELGELPDYIAVPSAYGDGLYGTWKGCRDLVETGIAKNKPHMIQSEVYGSMKETLRQKSETIITVPKDRDWTVSFSIGGDTSTMQAYAAMKESDGMAETSNDDETMAMQALLGRMEGIYAEASSVTTLVAIEKLAAAGKIPADATVVAVISSSGLKDPESTAERMPAVPTIQPNFEELGRALREDYGVDLKI